MQTATLTIALSPAIISESQLLKLATICTRKKISLDEAVCEAVRNYAEADDSTPDARAQDEAPAALPA